MSTLDRLGSQPNLIIKINYINQYKVGVRNNIT
jgi:hypothetical protein